MRSYATVLVPRMSLSACLPNGVAAGHGTVAGHACSHSGPAKSVDTDILRSRRNSCGVRTVGHRACRAVCESPRRAARARAVNPVERRPQAGIVRGDVAAIRALCTSCAAEMAEPGERSRECICEASWRQDAGRWRYARRRVSGPRGRPRPTGFAVSSRIALQMAGRACPGSKKPAVQFSEVRGTPFPLAKSFCVDWYKRRSRPVRRRGARAVHGLVCSGDAEGGCW